jgi:hypothetical protein
MQLMIGRRIAHALFLSLALPACGADGFGVETPEDVSVGAAVTSASTGQGIMVDVDVAGSLALVTNRTYEFDETIAATFFTNAALPSPAVTCLGDGCSHCAAPIRPDPPPPSEPALAQLVLQSKCTFLDGGLLGSVQYTQRASSQVQCLTFPEGVVSATYTYEWTYRVVPRASAVSPLTAWELKDQASSGNTASIDVTSIIAGESALSSKAQPRKYSFSLLDSDGTLRVQDLAVSLDGRAPTPLASIYVQNAPGAQAGDPGALDFNYVTNAGSNGNLSLLAEGDARTILNTDSFAGNQEGGANGSALAAVITAPVSFQLPVGDHSLVLTGKVKDNSAQSSSALSVSRIVHVVTPGCSSN